MGQAWQVTVTGICGEQWLAGGADITAPKYSVSRAKTSVQRRVRLVLQKLCVRMENTESSVTVPVRLPARGPLRRWDPSQQFLLRYFNLSHLNPVR